MIEMKLNVDLYDYFGRVYEQCPCQITVRMSEETKRKLASETEWEDVKDGDLELVSAEIVDEHVLGYMIGTTCAEPANVAKRVFDDLVDNFDSLAEIVGEALYVPA